MQRTVKEPSLKDWIKFMQNSFPKGDIEKVAIGKKNSVIVMEIKGEQDANQSEISKGTEVRD